MTAPTPFYRRRNFWLVAFFLPLAILIVILGLRG